MATNLSKVVVEMNATAQEECLKIKKSAGIRDGLLNCTECPINAVCTLLTPTTPEESNLSKVVRSKALH